MEIKIVKSVKDDYCEGIGPSETTHAFLSLDGMLFEIGKFYAGPHQNDNTSRRLKKVLELEERLKTIGNLI